MADDEHEDQPLLPGVVKRPPAGAIRKEVTTNRGLQQQNDSGSGGLASGNVGEASQGTAERQAFLARGPRGPEASLPGRGNEAVDASAAPPRAREESPGQRADGARARERQDEA